MNTNMNVNMTAINLKTFINITVALGVLFDL